MHLRQQHRSLKLVAYSHKVTTNSSSSLVYGCIHLGVHQREKMLLCCLVGLIRSCSSWQSVFRWQMKTFLDEPGFLWCRCLWRLRCHMFFWRAALQQVHHWSDALHPTSPLLSPACNCPWSFICTTDQVASTPDFDKLFDRCSLLFCSRWREEDERKTYILSRRSPLKLLFAGEGGICKTVLFLWL